MGEDRDQADQLRYRLLIADHGPGAASVHDLEGRYLWASTGFEDLLGMPAAELVGRDAYELLHPEDVHQIRTSHETIVELPTSYMVRYRIRRSDGTYRWVETVSQVVDGEHVIVALTHPVDEQRSAVEALQAERVIAERAQAVARQQEQFLTTISHRARQPVTVVLGAAELLLLRWRTLEVSQIEDLLQRVVAQAERLHELARDVTEADRLARGATRLQLRPIELAKAARTQVATLADGDAPIDIDIAGRTLLFADPTLVGLVLQVLVDNAIKHTPVGTHIWIRAQRDRDGLVLIVEDDGPGVDAGRRQQIFEPFEGPGLDDPDPGLGLGLYTVARIAAAHRGRAWVQPRPGGGASFRVLFPAGGSQESEPRVDTISLDEAPLPTPRR